METERDGDWIRGLCIGKGSFGTVSLAHRKTDSRVFAVKSVALTPSSSNNSVASLENEIEILRSLDSCYVVSYLGDSTTGGQRNLHMDYVPGGTVADVAGTLDEAQVRAYTRRITRALLYLHCVAGVVHSDVKGRNVLAGPTPDSAKLADFGSARRISDRPQAGGGTPLWMAPEVVRGEPATPESDIWSLGCTVVEMVTGCQPWKDLGAGSGQDKLFMIGYGDKLPELPSQLSKAGLDFVDNCLRRNPAERWSAERLVKHPFLADAGETAMQKSPRSVLDWVDSEFDDEKEDDDDDDDDAMNLGRERIRELAENCGEVPNWESEGWETVRHLEEGGRKRIEECLRGEMGNLREEASGKGLANEMRSNSPNWDGCCSCSCTCSCCDCCKGRIVCQVVVVANANLILFTLVLHLYRQYTFVQLMRFLNF